MTWVRLDDRFHDNRKIKRLWHSEPAALGLHVMAITYCAGHETDGLVDPEFIKEKASQSKDRDRMVTALIDSGLWVAEDAGWRIHDYLDFNPTHASLDEKREADAERKRLGRKTQSAKRPTGLHADSNGTPGGIREDSPQTPVGVGAESSGPVPSRPDLLPPDPPRGARQRDADRFEEEVRTYAAELLPDENPADALSAVRSALGTLRDRGLVLTADVVRSEAAFWLGKDETGLSEDARERLRQLGDRFSAFNRNAESSA